MIRLEDIKHVVCREYGLSKKEIEGQSRARRIAYPRQVAMYLGRKLTSLSLPDIGNRFGGRDHTTALYACRQVEARTDETPRLADTILRLENTLTRHERIKGKMAFGDWLDIDKRREQRTDEVYQRKNIVTAEELSRRAALAAKYHKKKPIILAPGCEGGYY